MSQFIEMFYNGKYTVDKLREHIDVIRGVSYKPSDVYETHNENTSIVLRSNNIEGGQINFDDLVYVSTERVSELQLLRVGDIVMCGSNGSKKLVGKAAMLQETPTIRTSFGAFCLGIRCKLTLVPEYLATYFQTSLYRDEIEQLGSGSNILNIKPDHIYDLEVPIPLYDEQMAFVSIVRQADKSEFVGFKSQFIEMYKDLLVNGKIEDLVDRKIASVKKSYHDSDEIEYIDISSIDNISNTIVETTKYEVSNAPSRAQQCVKKGDILVSTVRPINRNIAVVTRGLQNLVASTGFCVLRPKEEYREYLLSIVKSDAYTEHMCDKASGGLYPAVNNGDVFSYGIHIPNKELAQKVSTIHHQADKSEYYN